MFAAISCTWNGVEDVGRLCRDCSVDVIEIGEYYVVTDEVWPIEHDGGVLCVGCVEARLGRELVARDFTDALLNRLPGSSSRMRARLGGGAV